MVCKSSALPPQRGAPSLGSARLDGLGRRLQAARHPIARLGILRRTRRGCVSKLFCWGGGLIPNTKVRRNEVQALGLALFVGPMSAADS